MRFLVVTIVAWVIGYYLLDLVTDLSGNACGLLSFLVAIFIGGTTKE